MASKQRRVMKRLGGVLITLILIGLGSPARAQEPPLPRRMAAIGDSITMATNVCCFYGNRPRYSWSIGWDAGDPVRSHYERILALQPLIAGRNYNAARPGAKMADAKEQAAQVVTQRARYVTILMGANDVCTSSPQTMTSVAEFRAGFRAAMATLHSGIPKARIFVSSIPNVYRLWNIFHDDLIARLIWDSANVCQSMLSSTNTEEERQVVLARERAFNDVLADVCSQYTRCRFDGKAVFRYSFRSGQVSKLDYFHPNRDGQAALASVTWARTWWAA
jgi:lysophospholipase L1-like esterase